ncbi:RNA polymerase II subunit A C-terminal domain phosphatase SSU72-like [Corticium candelabrum]|uniref:RNA polymerase II subunit A C-terminal domain phosphatase SSU72-like n=1 Tax=Corticium candelabrum TaxID=121492 RepID=UPI002E27685E|nr:RNA polymerase II subunit A C-terminal domain phosphatase SSU72-like [Corticium candelabrum]
MSTLKIAVVCSSNQNRSMEAHKFLSKKGFNVQSFGTNGHVKIPGPSATQPNIYSFDATYEDMFQDLVEKDKILYTQNGMLHMLERNKRIKLKPERFQDSPTVFNLIVTCEERVYDQVVEDLESRGCSACQPVHVVNVEIQDNHDDATLGAFHICDLCQLAREKEDLESEMDEVIAAFESKVDRPILHTVCFY